MKQLKLKGTYASIDLDDIVRNYKETCKLTGSDVTVICVSTVAEAIRLREQFPSIDILVLGYTPRFMADRVSKYNFIQTISIFEEAEALSKAGPSKVHIKVNTGMNRLGFPLDSNNPDPTKIQFNKFKSIIDELESRKVSLGVRHVCNSGGIPAYKDMHMDMVRGGIMLYGLYPSASVRRNDAELKECMELRSFIARIMNVKKGDGISYGHTFTADKDMRIAAVNPGYSDGVFRNLSNKGEAIIHDERRPIIGRVCMNMFMVDITGMNEVHVGDEVIVFGKSNNQFISIDEVAKWVGTISYEIICRTGYSIPRVYFKNGKIMDYEQNLPVKDSI